MRADSLVGPARAAGHEMIARVANAQATRDHFFGSAYRWGRNDCVAIAGFHLALAGRPLPELPAYKDARGAIRALKGAGFATLADALDAQGLERITPAEARVGDLLCGASRNPLGAIGVALGNGALIGFAEGLMKAVVMRQRELACAWRVPHG